MKKILIMLILVSCIILTACGPGTSTIYYFENFDELIEVLDGKFMFPTYSYYPDGFDSELSDENVVPWGTISCIYGYTINNTNMNNSDTYFISSITVNYIDYESPGYDSEMHRILRNIVTKINNYNEEKIYIGENIVPEDNYYNEVSGYKNITCISNSYIVYKNYIPYYIDFRVIINTTNEERVAALLPEVNEMTYTEAMKMFDSLQPLN